MPGGTFFRKGAVLSLLVLWASFAFSSALSEISFTAALVFWLIWKIRDKAWGIQISKPALGILAAFTGWCALSYFWSEAQPQSFRGIFKIAQQAMIFVIAADSLRKPSELSLWEKVFAAMITVLLIDAVFQAVTGRDFLRRIAAQDSGAGIRLSASFKTYGLLACYLIVTLPVLLLRAVRSWKSKQSLPALFFSLLFVSGCGVLFFTKSRGAILAFLSGILFLGIYFKNWRFLVAAGILGVAAFALLPDSIRIHLDAARKEQSLVERYYLWDRAVSVIKAKPLTGTGINTYAVAHQKYDTTQNWRVRNYYAHNGYLQLAAETGLPGLFFFLAFLLYHLAWSFRQMAPLKDASGQEILVPLGLMTAILSFLLFAGIDTVLHNEQSAMAFWYLLGLQSACLSLRSSKTA